MKYNKLFSYFLIFQDIEAYVKMEGAERRKDMAEIKEKIKSEEEKRLGRFCPRTCKCLKNQNMLLAPLDIFLR